jgi:YbbR domain-containing protein
MTLNIERRLSAQLPLTARYQGQTAPGFDISRVTLMPSTVQVSGPRSIVEALSAIDTEPIPLDGRAASFTAQVGLVSPAKTVTLDEGAESSQVTAAVILAERLGTGRFTVPITAVGLASSLSFAEEPPALVLELSGAQNALGRIRASDLRATVNLASIVTPGTYTLPVVFAAPQGLTVASRSASSVTVTIVEEER